MKSMKKVTKKIMALVLAVVCIMGLTACGSGKKNTNTEVGASSTLEIYCLNAGYGTEWLTEMVELFKEQDWVKEKYPDLQIEYPMVNDQRAYAQSLLNSGSKANKYDLIFGIDYRDFVGPTGELLELSDVLYNQKVPGEDVLYKDKMNESALLSNKYIDASNASEESYYSTVWAGGCVSFLYNKTILESFGLSEPNTTDELIKACAVIKANEGKDNGKFNKGASIIQSSDAEYWQYIFPIWWAQYDGVEAYSDFYNGISNGRYSTDIFKKEGRLESLKVFETLLDYDSGYLSKNSFNYQFMQSQTSFLQGEAVFHVNGDWFANEMASTMKEIGSTDKFGTMRMPIVSALGTKLGITDAELSAIVDYVDGDVAEQPAFTSTKGYSAEQVIESVTEARSVNFSTGSSHMASIPKYAEGKEVAADFLLFMATDEALECYAKATGGSTLPFEYDIKTKNPELYQTFSSFTQDVQSYFDNGNFTVHTLPAADAFPLSKYGGLNPIITYSFYTDFSSNNNTVTAQSLFDETIAYWTTEKFNSSLSKAGLK